MKVLIAVEDKNFGETIIDYILKNSWDSSTKFKILHIVEPFEMGEEMAVTYSPFLDDTRAQVKALAAELVYKLSLKLREGFVNNSIESTVIEGHAKEKVLEEAEHWQADLLCVGTHGRSGISKFLLGSVSQAIASHAPCAVLIVRKPKES